MNESTPARKTPLYSLHLELGARMAPFGGFDMPIQYDSIINEHHATRRQATLFDTCHMGEFIIEGNGALATLENLVTCPVADLACGACRYGLMCGEDGGTIDDLLIYREADTRYMMVVNAGTQDGDFKWVSDHLAPQTDIRNISEDTGKIDLQGPQSPALLDALMPGVSTGLGYFRFRAAQWQGQPVTVSRTGYTGERGYEIYLAPSQAEPFWREAMRVGAVPAGLGARDTLRLESGLPLYGHELRRDRNAATTALTRAVSPNKPFIGAEALRSPEARHQTLAGLLLHGRQAAREGDILSTVDGAEVGTVTSGSFGPSVGAAIAMAVINRGLAVPDTELLIRTARKPLPCKVVPLPFYTGTARS
ncbi:MAG TPA: glycine cleavage system aminomethyltransferase GcvT [Verrucomicrobia bacterium]|nr:glycine cleavage system aminomethyltransferase GcvT [Verrucomicrobiota bacterium]